MTARRFFVRAAAVAALAVLATAPDATAQGRGGNQPPPTPQAAATDDLTGYWVAVISEDWRWRMVTPARGDVQSIPVSAEGLAIAQAWDPAADAAAGLECKSYGPPGLMRAPTRLNITWADEQTLQLQSDYGQQTRVLHFGDVAAPGAPSLQGHSVAAWEGGGGGRGGGPRAGHLVTTTTGLTEGYLRKNGVPYSEDTVLTEYWDAFDAPNGDRWLVVTSVVHDPNYLQIDWITSLNFKQEPDGANWNPTACSTEW
jgi:hypothetical protein